ncbi:hypothetical protein ACJJTC_008661 [Scirpophaga incertulas]
MKAGDISYSFPTGDTEGIQPSVKSQEDEEVSTRSIQSTDKSDDEGETEVSNEAIQEHIRRVAASSGRLSESVNAQLGASFTVRRTGQAALGGVESIKLSPFKNQTFRYPGAILNLLNSTKRTTLKLIKLQQNNKQRTKQQ